MDNNMHKEMWKAVWHIIRVRCANWEVAATPVSPDTVVVQKIGVSLRENTYKVVCICKNIILPLLYLYAYVIGL